VIAYPVAALTGLCVIVTRPAKQASALCSQISALGGSVIEFPVTLIESLPMQTVAERYDLHIFVSTNAVEHGLAYVGNGASIAAIGPATAKALVEAKRTVDYLAPAPHNSEALLELPEFSNVTGQRILIVRGEGGRETLRDTLIARGAKVDYLEVYRRVRAQPSAQALAQLQAPSREDQIQLITLTSVEILDHWIALLGSSVTHFARTPFVVSSERIEVAARLQGLKGECILATTASDDALIGAIASWHVRARAA
jgi:uroporphyrinogen-III synthase